MNMRLHLGWTEQNVCAEPCCVSEISSPFFFLLPTTLCSTHHYPPCRYLSPWFKTEYYVTKWVEDVNKNTEGPYIRYFQKLFCTPTSSSRALLFLFVLFSARQVNSHLLIFLSLTCIHKVLGPPPCSLEGDPTASSASNCEMPLSLNSPYNCICTNPIIGLNSEFH